MGGSVMNTWFLMESSHYQVPGDSHITDHLAHPLWTNCLEKWAGLWASLQRLELSVSAAPS